MAPGWKVRSHKKRDKRRISVAVKFSGTLTNKNTPTGKSQSPRAIVASRTAFSRLFAHQIARPTGWRWANKPRWCPTTTQFGAQARRAGSSTIRGKRAPSAGRCCRLWCGGRTTGAACRWRLPEHEALCCLFRWQCSLAAAANESPSPPSRGKIIPNTRRHHHRESNLTNCSRRFQGRQSAEMRRFQIIITHKTRLQSALHSLVYATIAKSKYTFRVCLLAKRSQSGVVLGSKSYYIDGRKLRCEKRIFSYTFTCWAFKIISHK